MQVDQGGIAHDFGLVGFDEANPAHVCRQVVDLVDALRRAQGVLPTSQIELPELVSVGGLVFGSFQVDATHEVAVFAQVVAEVMANEAYGSSHEDTRALSVGESDGTLRVPHLANGRPRLPRTR